MSNPNLGALAARALLRLRLALLRANPLTLAAAFLLLAVAGGACWTSYAVGALQARRAAQNAQAARAPRATPPGVAALPASAPVPEQDNLAAFYGALGERRHAERQVKTLFDLAAKSGLSLAQGEYKSAYDRNAHVWTYQVNLPVKGSYAAIWQFAFGALRAIPFASLDDIGFRRDAIGDPQVEARLRLTLYLSELPAARPDRLAGGAP
ncbi:hypothetical protein [Massilia sp. 9096]|uniref:hypothetical protein n=1 Tax=Massilia sp. 9096 TaxID=1500894 RepID=UPI000562AA04|nr:hypothetical protein [Massilia sp. 9096]